MNSKVKKRKFNKQQQKKKTLNNTAQFPEMLTMWSVTVHWLILSHPLLSSERHMYDYTSHQIASDSMKGLSDWEANCSRWGMFQNQGLTVFGRGSLFADTCTFAVLI